MKTQISRNSFQANKRYAGVYQQQGRMLTDADWNNLVDVLKGHLSEALKDVTGTGSPRTGALTIDTTALTIIPGDLYVDGFRASLPGTADERIPVTDQPDFPEAPELPDPSVDPYVLYADVWERSLTALEDPGLRDAGLNGADTGTRTQTMLQIKTCPETVDPENAIPQHGDAALTLTLHGNRESGDPCDPCAGQVDAGGGRIGNYLFRLEVHRFEGTADDPAHLTLKWSSENGAEQYDALDDGSMPPGFVDSRYMYEFFNLTTEKHLGVHRAPGFSPTPGILTPDYDIPDGTLAPKVFVRRWDGYCELVYNGSAWSLSVGWDKGVDLSTTAADTAPGYVSLGSSLIVNLEALALKLALNGGTFVAGDYWLAPVREAEHGPGSRVLADTPPEGIVHHYLRLARVAADGSVQLFDDDADRRRHSFPPLTDLWASDVDYRAECSEGLFQDFSGTVKEALDKVCAIQARDVGFPKPCDTSIYQGQTVATVEDALKLLCDVKAGQIAYQPGSGCTALPGINTVQAALDALCVRPAGGGCKVTVGEGGQFDTLDKAIQTLLSQKVFDICICLLPGEHTFGGVWQKEKEFERFNLTISGCGPGTKVILKDSLRFIGLTSLRLENFNINAMSDELPVTVDGCAGLDISNLHHVGLAIKTPLIRLAGGEQVRLVGNILEAYTTVGMVKPQKVFDFDPELMDLYTAPQRDDFLGRCGDKADQLARLHQNERRAIAREILVKLEQTGEDLTPNERMSYQQLTNALSLENVEAPTLYDRLREVRDQAHHAAAGAGVVFMDALASVALENNTVFGSVCFYGMPRAEDLGRNEIAKLAEMLKASGLVRFLAHGASLQALDNRISRCSVGAPMLKTVRELVAAGEGMIQGLYRTAQFESNIVAVARNQLLFENLTLASEDFQTLLDPIGWVVGETAIYTGNRVRRTRDPNSGQPVGGGRMQTAARDLAKAANLPDGSW